VKTPRGTRRPGRPPVSEPALVLVDKDGLPLDESQVVVIHDGLPVVKAEEIYELLVQCHGKVEHGGREKTFKEVKAKWSWVPKGASLLLSLPFFPVLTDLSAHRTRRPFRQGLPRLLLE
jgi:hypothetical protein